MKFRAINLEGDYDIKTDCSSGLDAVKSLIQNIDDNYSHDDFYDDGYFYYYVKNIESKKVKKYNHIRKIEVTSEAEEQELTESDINFMTENFKNQNPINKFLIMSDDDAKFNFDNAFESENFDTAAKDFADSFNERDVLSDEELDFMVINLLTNEYKSYHLWVNVKVDDIINEVEITENDKEDINRYLN
ncbi:hypothetical protein GCL60_16380 [Silvanigrella paludirubra]|uniref:Uncharacterized protein n=1 Tax=Silvanigrella paludirubra TaxID=2499159 RepID=A0A6N6VRJ8_9BACT|nr:hypothetical protein [Silvanigrella paludirubra]KAB8035805.1 hypothetical protein GCL60_16380 [Silvanigrella paludirubra]